MTGSFYWLKLKKAGVLLRHSRNLSYGLYEFGKDIRVFCRQL